MPLAETVVERANARLGTVLKGKWRLDAVIGIGGMASVYSATHRNQARVAIKLLHAEVALDAEVTARFLREGYLANAVGHPGTVAILDDDMTEDNAPFLVMELLIGQTLDTLLALEPEGLAAREVVPWIDQLLEVLIAAHDKGIVHRDLKPENIFLTSEGRLKVLDFGIARLRELSAHGATGTQNGTVLGTPAFMAPEQALGRWNDVDGRTDIWAVGATAFTLLTGRHVHEAESLQEQLVLSATRTAERLRDVRPGIEKELGAVIDRALSFARGDRYPDARAMRRAVRGAAPRVLSDGFTPSLPSRAPDARASTHDDQHDVTLAAVNEVSAAITAREETATTGRAVARSTSARSPSHSQTWRIAAASAALTCATLAGLFWFERQRAGELRRTAPVATDASPATNSSAIALSSNASKVPSVDPSLVPPSEPIAVKPKPAAPKPFVRPASTSPSAAPKPRAEHAVVVTKSLSNGDSPFDRRH